MKTLHKTITSQFFNSENGYAELLQLWKMHTEDSDLRKSLTASDHARYLILRGKDWRKAFTPITNSIKLANGMTPHGSRDHVMRQVAYGSNGSIFKSLLSPHAQMIIRSLLQIAPEAQAYSDEVAQTLVGTAA